MRQKLRLKVLVCITALFLFGNYSSVYGEVSKGDIGVGLNYPGGSGRQCKVSVERQRLS